MDAAKLSAARQDDASFAKLIIDPNMPELLEYLRGGLRRCGLPDVDAESIAGEVFLAVKGSIENFAPGSPFTPWLRGIARFKLVDHLRKEFARRDRAAGGSDVDDRLGTIAVQVDSGLSTREYREWLLRRIEEVAREKLAPREYQVFGLSIIQDLSSDEVAERLNTTANNVRVTKTRCLKKLREVLEEDLGSTVWTLFR